MELRIVLFAILFFIELTSAFYDEYDDQELYHRSTSISSYNCVENSDTIECYHTVLKEREPLQYSGLGRITRILFKDSKVSLIPVGVFAAFTSVTELYLNGSFVKSIQPGAFTGLNNLVYLYLEKNNITEIWKGVFVSLPNLKILHLEYNYIKTIEDKSFLGLHVIRVNNQLEKLPFDIFQNLNTLEHVYLSHNNLIEIPGCRLKNLWNFDLSNNNLKVFNNKLHRNSSSMKHLDLSNNLIEVVEIADRGLEYLNVSGNGIRELNNSMFNRFSELRVLDISHNFVSNLSQNIFDGLSNLDRLLLQNNELEYIPIGLFSHLRLLIELNLSNNSIFEFEYGTFSGLSHLQKLDVSNNKLIYLYESSFQTLTELLYLNIDGNLISSFDAEGLLGHLSKLQIIELDRNPWNCRTLSDIVDSFHKRQVNVTEGVTKKTKNVNHIGCSIYKYENSELAATSSTDGEHHSVSGELNAIYRFLNSDFHKFFENINNATMNKNLNENYFRTLFSKYFEDGFKNTTFYKYFAKSDSADQFFKGFDGAFVKFDADLKNSSLFAIFGTNNTLTNYFDEGFKSSAFYKYFNGGDFGANLDKGVDSNLSKLRNYFNGGEFQRSAFYQFFTAKNVTNEALENYLRTHGGLFGPNVTENVYSERFTVEKSQLKGENELVAELLDNMKAAKTSNSVLLIIVIIILLCGVLVLSLKHVPSNIKRKMSESKSLCGKDSAKYSNSEVELV